jgi:hypothetical protein
MGFDYLRQSAYLVRLADLKVKVYEKEGVDAAVKKRLMEAADSWPAEDDWEELWRMGLEAEPVESDEARQELMRELVLRQKIDELLDSWGIEDPRPGNRWQQYDENGNLCYGSLFRPRLYADSISVRSGFHEPMDVDYLVFGDHEMFVERREVEREEGKRIIRETIIREPSKAYLNLCEYLDVQEINESHWVFVSF